MPHYTPALFDWAFCTHDTVQNVAFLERLDSPGAPECIHLDPDAIARYLHAVVYCIYQLCSQ